MPLQDNHIFPIGSNTKFFTAVAIYQLQEKGLLNVSDAVNYERAWLPDEQFHQIAPHPSLCIGNSHTSGHLILLCFSAGERVHRSCRFWTGWSLVPQGPWPGAAGMPGAHLQAAAPDDLWAASL